MNNIDLSATKVFGIIGSPLAHSLSPLMHNIILKESGINAVYLPFCVKDRLEAVISGAHALGIKGLNITLPYKHEVLNYLSEVDAEACEIGAVNTLVYQTNGYKGYNTDICGLRKSVTDSEIDIKNRPVVILGAGGAARAAVYVCIGLGAAEIVIANRSFNQAFLLQKKFKKYLNIALCNLSEVTAVVKKYQKNSAVIFQTTSVGMYPDNDKCIINNRELYEHCCMGVELIYNPLRSRFILNMENAGKRVINGLDMLVNQGILSWERWNQGMKVSENTRKQIKLSLEQFLK